MTGCEPLADLEKILHIEDEEDIREIALMVLELMGGFQVKQADCGEAALEIVEEFAPDLMLVDVQMPGMTGPEALIAIRKMPGFENIPAIIMTAKLVGSEAEALMVPGDLGVIGKPFDPNTLSDEIRALWNTRA
jgi:CheY-like chemotaxis protein